MRTKWFHFWWKVENNCKAFGEHNVAFNHEGGFALMDESKVVITTPKQNLQLKMIKLYFFLTMNSRQPVLLITTDTKIIEPESFSINMLKIWDF